MVSYIVEHHEHLTGRAHKRENTMSQESLDLTAMIEGGGLGIYTPEEVGPMSFQVPNGVVDILVEDERQAVQVARKYLSYFQGDVKTWESPEQRRLRHVIPENRLRLYDMREIINTLADEESVLEEAKKRQDSKQFLYRG